MTDQQLDEVYTEACQAISAVGDEQASLFLGRLALLLMLKLDDPAAIREVIAQAKNGIGKAVAAA